MTNPRIQSLVHELRRSNFAELHGARVTATIPIAERLINELIAVALPRSAPVRDVLVHPLPGNRIAVRARLSRADFLPPITLTAEIERQPELPDAPLVLRVLSLPGLLSIAAAATSFLATLPPGVRMDNQRVLVDLPLLLERHGFGEWVRYLEMVRITTEEGRLIADVALRVPADSAPAERRRLIGDQKSE